MSESLTVRLDERYAHIPERLGKREEGRFVVLGSMAEAVIMGALIGFEYGQRLSLGDVRENPIGFDIFQRAHLDEYAYLLAVTESQDLGILGAGREGDVISILEEYANGGFALLEKWSSEGESALLNTVLFKMDEKVREHLAENKAEVKITLKKRKTPPS